MNEIEKVECLIIKGYLLFYFCLNKNKPFMAGGKNMATPTTVNGKVTFHGAAEAITKFVRLNNLFLALHPKSITKDRICYYTNLFTDEEEPKFLTNVEEILEYLKTSQTFILDGSGRNDYLTNIQYHLKWLLDQFVTTFEDDPDAVKGLVDKVQFVINSGIKIDYEFTDDNFTDWDEWKGTVDLTGSVISVDKREVSYLDVENIKMIASSSI